MPEPPRAASFSGGRGEHREPVDASAEDTLPRCGECGALLRPDVVWFGEPLDAAVIDEALRAAAEADGLA